MSRTVNQADDYMSRVLKHIPSEIVMAYIAIDGVLRTSYNPNVRADRLMLEKLLWIARHPDGDHAPVAVARHARPARVAAFHIHALHSRLVLRPGWAFRHARLV